MCVERQPAETVFAHDVDECVELCCFEQSSGVPERFNFLSLAFRNSAQMTGLSRSAYKGLCATQI